MDIFCGNCLHYEKDLYGDFGFCPVYKIDVKPNSEACHAHYIRIQSPENKEDK